MLLTLLQSIIDGFGSILAGIVFLLPKSPFQAIDALTVGNDLLSSLAWLVPFPQIIALLEAWVGAIMLYYVYMAIMRWIKLIK